MPELIEKLRVAMVTISFVSTFSEPQNVEQGMSNYEVLFLFCLAVPMLVTNVPPVPMLVTNVPRGQILCIPSTFIIPCSTFDIQKSYPSVPMLVTNVPRGQILCIPSTFIIPCSTFDIQKSYPFNVLYLITFLYCTP
jgi:hypothetical protein